MPRPFISFTIDRFGDTAMVSVNRYWFEDDGGPVRSKILEHYETASRGATASARKAVEKAKAKEAAQ